MALAIHTDYFLLFEVFSEKETELPQECDLRHNVAHGMHPLITENASCTLGHPAMVNPVIDRQIESTTSHPTYIINYVAQRTDYKVNWTTMTKRSKKNKL